MNHITTRTISELPEVRFFPLAPHIPPGSTWENIFDAYEKIFPWLSKSIVKEQFYAYKEGRSPIIAAEEIKNIPIHENSEEMVDIRFLYDPRIFMLSNPSTPYNGSSENAGLPESSQVRKSVYEKLQTVISELDNLAPYFGFKTGQFSIKIFEGYRSLENQEKIFIMMFKKFKGENPLLTDHELEELTSQFVSPYKNNIPPHCSGAAVDMRLWDNEKNDFFDVCGFSAVWSPKECAATFSDNCEISVQQKLNRLYIVLAIDLAGMTNYPYEHWHHSFGDRYDAFWKKENCAIYGLPITIK